MALPPARDARRRGGAGAAGRVRSAPRARSASQAAHPRGRVLRHPRSRSGAGAMIRRVYIGIGSNLGDREFLIRKAVEALRQLPQTNVSGVSSLYDTEPVGETDQPPFLNAVAWIETELPARELLWQMLLIEKRMGRVRARRWGPRPIDLDLLLRRRGDRGAGPPGSAPRGPSPRLRAPPVARAGSELPAPRHRGDGAPDDPEAAPQPARAEAGALLVLTGEPHPAPGRYIAVEGVIGGVRRRWRASSPSACTRGSSWRSPRRIPSSRTSTRTRGGTRSRPRCSSS